MSLDALRAPEFRLVGCGRGFALKKYVVTTIDKVIRVIVVYLFGKAFFNNCKEDCFVFIRFEIFSDNKDTENREWAMRNKHILIPILISCCQNVYLKRFRR